MRTHHKNVVKTYRYLRLGMVLVVVLLGTSVVTQIIATQCQLRSISGYYFSPTRSIFVAALCVVGSMLIVYKGDSPTEDHVLNFAGFMAFAVGLVPTQLDSSCGTGSFLLTEAERSDSVFNNALALFVVAGGALVAQIIIGAVRLSLDWNLASFIGTALMLGYVGIFIFDRPWFEMWGHDVAAISLFVGIVAVVIANAIAFQPDPAKARPGPNRYFWVAVTMVLSFVGILLARFVFAKDWQEWIFYLEAVLIVEFAVFWILQTVELWGDEKLVIAYSGRQTGR